jgi:hypothetical protein
LDRPALGKAYDFQELLVDLRKIEEHQLILMARISGRGNILHDSRAGNRSRPWCVAGFSRKSDGAAGDSDVVGDPVRVRASGYTVDHYRVPGSNARNGIQSEIDAATIRGCICDIPGRHDGIGIRADHADRGLQRASLMNISAVAIGADAKAFHQTAPRLDVHAH